MPLDNRQNLSPDNTDLVNLPAGMRRGVSRRFFLKSMGAAAAAAVLADKAIIAGITKAEANRSAVPGFATTLSQRLSWKAFVCAPKNKSLRSNDDDSAYQGCLMGLRRDGKMFYQEFRWATSPNAAVLGVPVEFCQRANESSNQALQRAITAATKTMMNQFGRLDSEYEAVRARDFVSACAERPFATGPLYEVKSGIFRSTFEFDSRPVRRNGSAFPSARG